MQTYYSPTRIVIGSGVHAQAGSFLSEVGCRRVLLVADRALLETPIHAGVCAALHGEGIAWTVFSDIEPDPSDTSVAGAFELARNFEIDGVVALGGGSTMDVGKAVALLMTNGGTIHDYEGIKKFSTAPLPSLAIPTTAGTGSEVSGSCVITDTTRHLKMSIRHADYNPATVALLDPLAVATLPGHVAMHAGMDAFVHAFESFLSLDANPMTDALTLRAMELISASLLPFIANPRNEEAAQTMLCGSALAGMAFGITGLGNVHCISRFLGVHFHLSHGLSNALCLPHVAEFNRIAVPEKYARLARLFGCDKPGMTTMEAASTTVDFIRAFCIDAGVPARLRDAGIEAHAFDEIASQCAGAGYNRWNPRFTTEADFRSILEEAY